MPTASVLVLTWNHERYISQAIESILAQTWKDVEVILLDNCSSDDTLRIAKKILSESGIKYSIIERSAPCGIAENFNYLYTQSTGDYIFPLSGDDWYHPDMISTKIGYLKLNADVGVLSSGGWIYYDDVDQYEEMDVTNYLRGHIYKEVLQKAGAFNFVGLCYRRSVLEDVGLWDGNLLIEDLDMFIRISLKYKIDYLEEPLVFYRKNKNSASANVSYMIKGWEQYYDKYKAVSWVNMRHWLADRYRIYAALLIDKKQQKEALSLLWKSAKLNPLNINLVKTWAYYIRSL